MIKVSKGRFEQKVVLPYFSHSAYCNFMRISTRIKILKNLSIKRILKRASLHDWPHKFCKLSMALIIPSIYKLTYFKQYLSNTLSINLSSAIYGIVIVSIPENLRLYSATVSMECSFLAQFLLETPTIVSHGIASLII